MSTYVKIATIDLTGGSAASFDFTSIPSTYTDLCLKISTRSSISSVQDDMKILFNGVTAGYTSRQLLGTGSTNASYSSTASGQYYGFTDGNTATASTFASTEIYIPNYAGSNNKSSTIDTVTETNATTIYAALQASLWSNSSVISQITITPLTGTFNQYSSATLYGISKS